MAVDINKPEDTDPIVDWPEYIRSIAAAVDTLEGVVAGDYNRSVIAINSTDTMLIGDLNQVVITNSVADMSITLPEVTSEHKGSWVRIHKLGVGDLTIIPGGTDALANGGAASTLTNTESEAKAAMLELEVAGAGQWVIASMFGTWTFA